MLQPNTAPSQLRGGGISRLNTRMILTVTRERIDTSIICAFDGTAAGYGFALLVRSEDFKEGITSLIQKRKPDFQGR